jgi:hypothetical protein
LTTSLPEEQSPLEEPLSPIRRKKLGLALSFVTKVKKKAIKVATDSSMKNPSLMRGNYQAQWLKNKQW